MFPRFVVDELAVARTTESGPFNDRDEIYFTLSGSTSRAQVEVPRVSPPAPEDYYGLAAGQKARDIKLWQGFVGANQYAYLVVAAREQDNAQLGAIASAVKGAALGIAAIFVDPSLGPAALDALKDAATKFVGSLANDGDQTVGAFALRLNNQGGALKTEWFAISNATLASQSGASAVFELTGQNARYTVRTRAQRPQLPRLVNVKSGKVLDVVDASTADQAVVQQFTSHGGSNQRWLLQPFGLFPATPVSPLFFPSFVILAEHSGKALDVAGGSTANQAQVQQYPAHYGANQCWIQVPRGQAGEFVLVNLKSRKVLDVADGSLADGAKVQQYAFNDGANQRWRLQY